MSARTSGAVHRRLRGRVGSYGGGVFAGEDDGTSRLCARRPSEALHLRLSEPGPISGLRLGDGVSSQHTGSSTTGNQRKRRCRSDSLRFDGSDFKKCDPRRHCGAIWQDSETKTGPFAANRVRASLSGTPRLVRETGVGALIGPPPDRPLNKDCDVLRPRSDKGVPFASPDALFNFPKLSV